jgi:hypothetical protein
MSPAEAVAYLAAQTIACQCELVAMQEANRARLEQGHTVAYGEEAFRNLITQYGLHHNQICELYREANYYANS